MLILGVVIQIYLYIFEYSGMYYWLRCAVVQVQYMGEPVPSNIPNFRTPFTCLSTAS